MGTTGQSVTLANSIIGVGILAMPFCFQQCGLLLATLILVFMGLISRLCCYFLLKSALLARRRNFEFLAFHVFGSAGKMAVEVGIIGFLMGTCIAYFVVVGDLGPQIIAKMLKINQSDILRTSIMVVVSLVCVLPLGLLRNVDSLSNVSAATIGFYFCLVIKVIVEAASQLITGEWQSRVVMWKPAGMLQCVPIISMALFCQTQLFEIFESLPTLSLEKMNVVTKNAINICTGVYFTLGMFGYIAFGAQEISGNVLMSLSPTMASDVIKLGFVMSLAFSFPLIIFPCRASLYSFLYKKVHSPHHDHIINHSIPETTFRCITVAIIAVALFIGLLIPNIELVLGLVGSTIGVLICLVFPAACFVNVTFKNTNERILAKGVILLGLIIMVLGTYANLQAAENRIDRYDDKFITQERIDKIVEDFFERQENADVYLKPDVKNDPSPIDKHKKVIDYIAPVNDLNKDSEIQPPNPVPPESNEKLPDKKIEHRKEEENIIVIPEVKQTPEKVLEMHPKDLRTKFEAKLANGDTLINKNVVVDQFKELKPQSNEPKMEVKQKKLMETIKQHGEEQKVILDEIIKTQKELQQSKKDADPNEAKKIAVESIKKIANIAIKKLGDVSDKPNQLNDDNEVERLEKLKSKAVQEIAKKAFETIEAIQDIKPEPAKIDEVKKVEVPKFQENVLNTAPAQNISSQQVVQQVLPVNPIGSALKLDPDNNLVSQQNNPNLNLPPNNIIAQQNLPDSNLQKRSDMKPLINQNNANFVEVINENHNNVVIKQPEIAKKIVQDTKSDVLKTHSHSPDEPQSYKQGEEVQAKIPVQETKNALNKPIVNDITKQILIKKDDSQDIAVKSNNGVDINKYSNDADHKPNPVPERQKREVVDCTEKVSIKPEDREICDALSERKQKVMQDTQEYLPSKIDMNNIALPKDLPLEANILHHMRRSLKSYEKDKR